MTRTAGIPIVPLLLGLAGLIPFLWGALTVEPGALQHWGARTLGPRFVGPYVQLFYGAVILSFMSGVIWGFAARTEGREAAMLYVLSVLPALWAFLFTGGGPVSAAMFLAFGFALLLPVDWFAWSRGLAPEWWMRLRLLLTAVVVASLSVLIF